MQLGRGTWDVSDCDKSGSVPKNPDPIRFLPRPTSHVRSPSKLHVKFTLDPSKGGPISRVRHGLAK